MIKQVEIVFNSYLAQIFQSKPETLRFLMNHERKALAIRCTAEQIAKAETSNIKHRFNTERFRTLIFECAKMFANFALTNAEQQALSRLEVQRRIDEACRIAKIEEEFEADQKEFESKKLTSVAGRVAK